MKITNKEHIDALLDTVKQCKSDVYLKSVQGDQYNLKSELSTYIAIGDLLSDRGDDLELFCNNPEDESKFLRFFSENPEVL